MELSSFSVLISTYQNDNTEALKASLDSLINQSYLPTEIVLVIDGPINKDTEQIISVFKLTYKNELKIVKLEVNQGLGNALNIGLQHCTYELVARMDSDDIAVRNRFEIQINYFLQYPETSVLGGYMQEFAQDENECRFLQKKMAPLGKDYIKSYAQMRNPINHPTVMFKKSALIKIGSYKEINLFEDYYLWLRLLKNDFIINNVPQILLFFRVGSNLVERRHGFKYMTKEFNFILTCYKEKLISLKTFIGQLVTRLPLRILPKLLLQLFYQSVLRKK